MLQWLVIGRVLCPSGASLSSNMIYEVMNEMSPLINENDLHVSQVRINTKSVKQYSKYCQLFVMLDV